MAQKNRHHFVSLNYGANFLGHPSFPPPHHQRYCYCVTYLCRCNQICEFHYHCYTPVRVLLQVSEQPLSYGALTVNGRRQVRYNVRKLSELPYHLIESGMVAELRMHVLFNYDWLHSKLAATSLPDVLADFHMATTAFSDAAKVDCRSFISKI